ncbi:FliC/FljB family flagellin [Thorsellia anophelis]|uniref:Flagellin n=1 Tax=Thorsellia anophelis DSM 18579 TaxID=1123402 RepID=A0A1H9YYS8_9GAMM|nr:FliC/FljB family flagellin [Thorsellia anophelis]SES74262.1 flagellin [Thorsellia anophelis DSM 18579]
MSVINTNVMSLNTQLNLSRSQNALGTAIERLSSGMRINSAKDDAAGQAIANRFTSNIKGLSQARRNALDGISIAQTAGGALDEVNNNLQRIRELSVQAANGSNSQSDLDSIQAEVQQRLSEISRISAQTQFNGKKVLAEDNVLRLQVGAYDNETIDVNLVKTDVETLGLNGFNINGLSETPVDVTTILTGAEIDKMFGSVGAATGSLTLTATDGTAFGLAAGSATVDNTKIFQGKDGTLYAEVNFSGATGADLAKIEEAGFNTTDTYYVGIANGTAAVTNETAAGAGDGSVAVTFGAGSLNFSNVLASLSEAPLAAIDAAISKIDGIRGDLGAVQNRLDSTVNNLGTAVNNLSASRSRIEDADYAVEVSNMSRAQILQQAGTSVLSQANQVPQTVLSLLR